MTDLEAAADLARANRDAAIKREESLYLLIAAYTTISRASDDPTLTDTDRALAEQAYTATQALHTSALRTVGALGREIRGRLTDDVCDAEAALNAAEVAA